MEEVLKMDITNIDDCGVCCERINKSNRKAVVCPVEKCSYVCCRSCFVRYLMSSGMNVVCMNCKKDFSSEFLSLNLTKKAEKEHTDYMIQLTLEVVKGQLPEWQDQANSILRRRKFTDEFRKKTPDLLKFEHELEKVKLLIEGVYLKFKISKTAPFTRKVNKVNLSDWRNWVFRNHLICSLCDATTPIDITCTCECGVKKCRICLPFCLLLNDTKCVGCDREELSLEDIKARTSGTFFTKFFKPKNNIQNKPEMEEHKIQAIDLITRKLSLNSGFTAISTELYQIENVNFKKERFVRFVKKCPNGECRGFLSTAWKCGLCGDFFCTDCHKKKTGPDHVCDDAEKATVAMIKDATKPCPKCGMPIDRYTGCSQVWTPCCKIAFDWNTGKIVINERIHSPEYYDYMRRTNNGIVPREIGDDPCGGQIEYYRLRAALKNKKLRDKCIDYYRLMAHVNDVHLPELPAELGRIDHSEFGIKYLTGDIDDVKWKFILKKQIKKEKRENEIYHILRMFVKVMDDLLRLLEHERKTHKFIDSSEELIKYTNEQIGKINTKYKSVEKKYFIHSPY